ncbi:MAG: ATPase domain-containing protein [Acetobacteraceae bacterium]|nr:AAA family ATPase [Pseudomonadota bacterium]
MTDPSPATPPRISTGAAGLDTILQGGLAANRLYLIEGEPGAGKTTLAMQFLLEGRNRGERVLYVTLSETAEELATVVESHGWSLEGIDLFELAAAEAALGTERAMTLLHPWEVELGETVRLITDEVERTGAVRVVFDSLSEMRMLAQDALRFRRQILALKQFFAGRGTAVLLLDDMLQKAGADQHLRSLCHGVVTLERLSRDFGSTRRRLEVAKMRGASFQEGWHDYTIQRGGLIVFPRLDATRHHVPFVGEPVPSGLSELDAMLEGGPLRGTCALLSGPSGTGKSTLAMQYVHAAAERGEHCAIYQFDERVGTLLERVAKLGLDLAPHIQADKVVLMQIDPSDLSPGEFIEMLRQDVEANDTKLVVIDSLNGYLTSMPQEKRLVLQLHELLSYLNQRGVLTLLVSPQFGFITARERPLSISYIADAVLLLRFFEVSGRVRKAISIVKNRGGAHEDTIRELRIEEQGLRIGPVLSSFTHVLTGEPLFTGDADGLMHVQDEPDA